MPYRKNKADYIVKPDKYKHKKPKSNNPWSRNYDDSPEDNGGSFSQPQDYSQGYINPYVNTPNAPVFDRPSIQDNEANLRSFMADSNKPPHLQNRWKKQPSKPDFSQLSDREKCCCEPKEEEFDFDINENYKLPHSKAGQAFGDNDFLSKNKRPIWERAVRERLKDRLGVKEIYLQDIADTYRQDLCQCIQNVELIIEMAKEKKDDYELYEKMLKELIQGKAELEFILETITQNGIKVKISPVHFNGTTALKMRSKTIIIEVNSSTVAGELKLNLSNLAHELAHLFYFLSGTEAASTPNYAIETHDVYDELDAYIRERSVEHTRLLNPNIYTDKYGDRAGEVI